MELAARIVLIRAIQTIEFAIANKFFRYALSAAFKSIFAYLNNSGIIQHEKKTRAIIFFAEQFQVWRQNNLRDCSDVHPYHHCNGCFRHIRSCG